MKSTTAQQGSWRTKDGSAWWLRDARYNEPNGDYHANCYLHIYDVNPNNVRFNDGSCAYYSTEYLCQKVKKKKPAPKFSWAGNGKTNCGKNNPVASEAACKSAAKTLKKAYGGTGSYAAWPKSCFLYNNKLYFNKHKTGKANKQGNPLCAGAGDGKKTTKKQQGLKCRAGSASNCKVSTISTPKYSAGNILRIHNGRRVRKSTETDSCPNGYKIWSPRNKNDWTIVFNAMGKSINKYPKKPHFIIDVTRPANGCGGCTKYAMKSTTSQQGSWRTKDGSAWWLR